MYHLTGNFAPKADAFDAVELERASGQKKISEKMKQVAPKISSPQYENVNIKLKQKMISHRMRSSGSSADFNEPALPISPIKKLNDVANNPFSDFSFEDPFSEVKCKLNLDLEKECHSGQTPPTFILSLKASESKSKSSLNLDWGCQNLHLRGETPPTEILSYLENSESNACRTQIRVRELSSNASINSMSTISDSSLDRKLQSYNLSFEETIGDEGEDQAILDSSLFNEEFKCLNAKNSKSKNHSHVSKKLKVNHLEDKEQVLVKNYYDEILNDITTPVEEARIAVRKRKFHKILSPKKPLSEKNETILPPVRKAKVNSKEIIYAPISYNEQKYIERSERKLLTLDDYRDELIGVMWEKFKVSEETLMQLFACSIYDVGGNGWEMASARRCLDFCQGVAMDLGSPPSDDSMEAFFFDRIFEYFENEEEWPRIFR